MASFCSRYFCEGQKLSAEAAEALRGEGAAAHLRYRKMIGMGLPFALVHLVWWSQMVKHDSFGMFSERVGAERTPAYYMSITMIFGSMLAGATSEGGAAVAFPIMTLVFGIPPPVARDFSYMIQSVGMTAAAFTILFMRVQVEWKSITYCTAGGFAGVIFGLEQVAPRLTPPYAKMYFVVIWGSFAGSLYYLNRLQGRKVYLVVDPPHLPAIWKNADLVPAEYPLLALVLNWKALVLLAAGFLGGIFTAMSGSGIDICSFAVLTLLFRLTEKTATPTSVVLMAVNTFIAMCYRHFWQEGLQPDAWNFFVVCAPIVVVGAPLGSVLGSFLHRLVLAAFVYVTDGAQLIGALYVVRPWTREKCNAATDCAPADLCATSAVIFCVGLVFFYVLQRAGQELIGRNDEVEKQAGLPAMRIVKTEVSTSIAEEASNDPYIVPRTRILVDDDVEKEIEMKTENLAVDPGCAEA